MRGGKLSAVVASLSALAAIVGVEAQSAPGMLRRRRISKRRIRMLAIILAMAAPYWVTRSHSAVTPTPCCGRTEREQRRQGSTATERHLRLQRRRRVRLHAQQCHGPWTQQAYVKASNRGWVTISAMS